MTSALADILTNAHKGVRLHNQFDYSEGSNRMADVHTPWPAPPKRITCDCSGYVTYCWSWAGAPDPNGLNYDGQGYTGTELTHNQHIAIILSSNQEIKREEARPGDLVVYGPGNGEHVAIIIEKGEDPLTVSMGHQGAPEYVTVNADGRMPQTFLRPKTNKIGPIRKAIRKRLAVKIPPQMKG